MKNFLIRNTNNLSFRPFIALFIIWFFLGQGAAVCNAYVIFSDNFDDGSLDTSKWDTVTKNAHLTEGSGYMTFDRDNDLWGASLVTKDTFNFGSRIHFKWRASDASPDCGSLNDCGGGRQYIYSDPPTSRDSNYNQPDAGDFFVLGFNRRNGNLGVYVEENGVGFSGFSFVEPWNTNWHTFDWILNQDQSYEVYVDDVKYLEGSIINSYENFVIEAYNGNFSVDQYFMDDFEVIVPEPGGFVLLGLGILMMIAYKIFIWKYSEYKKNKREYKKIRGMA